MMKSLVVVALLALLPLAASLPTCQSSTTDKFLNMKQLDGGILEYVSNSKYFFYYKVKQLLVGPKIVLVSTFLVCDQSWRLDFEKYGIFPSTVT